MPLVGLCPTAVRTFVGHYPVLVADSGQDTVIRFVALAPPGMRGARAIEHIAARCAEAGGDFDGLEDRLRADGFVTFAVAVWDGRPHDADGSPVFSSPLSEET